MPQIFIRLFIISLLMWTPFAQAQTVVGGQTAGRSTSPIPVYSTDIYGNPVSAGTVGIAQTTPGTTNGVIVNNTSLPTTETYGNIAASASPVSIGQSATLIVAARTGRKEVTLILEAAVALRIGGSGVGSTTNGALLQGVAGEAITISGGAAVYGYAPSGTAIVSAIEVY
jgi:hypothetical protein